MNKSRSELYKAAHYLQFRKDVKAMKESGRKSLETKFMEIHQLLLDQSLETHIRLKGFQDHGLSGEWSGWRELHVQSDWLMIYRVDHQNKVVSFARTGTHADLFD